MALFTEYRRWRWQCQLRLFAPRNAWSNSRLLFVPKRVVSYCGESQRRAFGRSSSSRVRKIGRLQRDIQLELKSRRSVNCSLSEFGLSSSVSDRVGTEDHRPAFDLDLAVLLAGFAFESYNTPAKNEGILEVDGGDCETIYLSGHENNLSTTTKIRALLTFVCRINKEWTSSRGQGCIVTEVLHAVRGWNLLCLAHRFKHESRNSLYRSLKVEGEFIKSIYDGQLFVTLKKGVEFPGLDLWGTSDPYVVLRIGNCSVRSRTIWATRDPVWNENLALDVKTSSGQSLQLLAWDANVVIAHRRLGNTSVNLENLCDGKQHSLELSLEGMGGGGKIFLEVLFKSFAQIEAEKNPLSIGGLLGGELLGNAYKSVFGENGISVGEFMSVFMSNLNTGIDLSAPLTANLDTSESEDPSAKENGQLSQTSNGGVADPELPKISSTTNSTQRETSDEPQDGDLMKKVGNEEDDGDGGEAEVWNSLAESFSQTLKPFGIDLSAVLKDRDAWEVGEDVKSLGLESQKRAEFLYAESGLAIVDGGKVESEISSKRETDSGIEETPGEDWEPLPAGKEVLDSLIQQTEGIVGTWALFNKSQGLEQSSGQDEPRAGESEPAITTVKTSTENERTDPGNQKDVDDERDEVKPTMFSTAESAMASWALLATTVGGASLVKSDFEKVCFVENSKTDTQVAIRRDLRRQRLVVAFRGTEQTKWQDVVTDISLLPAGFNPERVAGGDNLKDEPLVHSGFLKAYDSVKSRILSLVRGSIQNSIKSPYDIWHIHVTGHSLGGALATLFAFELSTSNLAKYEQRPYTLQNDRHVTGITWNVDILARNHDLRVTMYNYGSPRVGDKKFADNYNQIVKDSWRVVNHRDIVPTVPRLLGYCHVAQPIYLAADESPISELLDDGYHGDVLGEATPNVLFDKFMKGEQTLLQKLLETEISMLRAMRDGSAVMQHMEDFYYITLLQRVESRVRVTNKIV